jgi:hypothetical protein
LSCTLPSPGATTPLSTPWALLWVTLITLLWLTNRRFVGHSSVNMYRKCLWCQDH